MALDNKLFYSYNSPWLQGNSLNYSQNYTYSVIFNKKNHKIVQNGTEYGIFHDNNYISCLSSDCFLNPWNVIAVQGGGCICIKVPAQANNWGNKNISFDVILSNGDKFAKYTIGGWLGGPSGHPSQHSWGQVYAHCVASQEIKNRNNNGTYGKRSNELSDLPVKFCYQWNRNTGTTAAALQAQCYYPIVVIGPTTQTTVNINICNITSSDNFENSSYNFIDTNAHDDQKWEIFTQVESQITTANKYYTSNTIVETLIDADNASTANYLSTSKNIWGQPFNGSEDISGDFTLNSSNNWIKYQTGQDTNSYILRTSYLNVNSDFLELNRNYAFNVNGGSRFGGYVGIGWGPQTVYDKGVRLYITGMTAQPRIHPSQTNRFYSLMTEYGLHYLGDPVGIGTHPVLDGNTDGGTDGRGAMLTVRSTYPEDNRNPISIYSAGGDNILKGDTSIGINTFNGTPSRRLYIDGGSSNNYAIYSQNGQNYFSERVGIGIEPTNTAYMLNVNGKIWAQSGVNVYGHGLSWNGTQNCGININNVSTASADQLIKVFCINSLKNGDVYTYWNCGIYTMKNSDRRWASDTEAGTAYNLLLYTADTSTNGSKALYSFSANPDYNGTVALNEGTTYNLVCLGVIKLYRSQVNSPWEAVRIAGNLNPSTIVQPTASTTEPTSSTVGTSGVKITFTLSSTKHISRSTIKICSAIPVINSIFFNNRSVPVAQIALNSGVNIANNIIQMYAHTSTATSVNTSAITDGIIVWGTSYDIRVQNALSNVMTSTGNGYPSSIKVTLFGYYS